MLATNLFSLTCGDVTRLASKFGFVSPEMSLPDGQAPAHIAYVENSN